MRRLILLLCLVLAVNAGCKRREKARVQTIEESSVGLASTVNMADPRQSTQLVSGFYDVEQNAWRWTKGKFSVVLKPTKGPAALVVHLAIPESVMSKVKTVTLTATVNGTALPPQTYTKDGEDVYKQDVPVSALTGDAVTVAFSLDKFLAAGAIEERELGIVVSSIGLEAK